MIELCFSKLTRIVLKTVKKNVLSFYFCACDVNLFLCQGKQIEFS